MIHTEKYIVHGTEIDHTYRLTEPYLLSLFQDAFARYCAELGIAAYDLQRDQKTWILSDFHARFNGDLPRWNHEIRFDVWARKNQSFRMYADFRAFDGDGKLCASGTSCWLILDEVLRIPVDHTETFSKLALTSNQAVPGFRFAKMETIEGPAFEEMMKIRSSDIDFNLHLNSVRYIGAGILGVPFNFRQRHRLTWLTIKYNQEAVLDQELRSVTIAAGNKNLHLLTDQSGQIEYSRMITCWEGRHYTE